MALSQVVVGCKLPNGIILEHPENPLKKVELDGLNKIKIIGSEYVTNSVDEEFWDAWFAKHADFPAVKSGAIFVAKNATEAKAVAKDLAKEKTGFEAMNPKSHGVKPADKDE